MPAAILAKVHSVVSTNLGSRPAKTLNLFQIKRAEAFGGPAVDRSERLASLVPLARSR